MAEVTRLTVSGYRSVGEEAVIRFPQRAPLVLIGENNAGKTNIARALDLLLGETWPGTYVPDEHEYWQRSKMGGDIRIKAHVRDVWHPRDGRVEWIGLQFPSEDSTAAHMKFFDKNESQWARGDVRDRCKCIYLGTDRRLSYQLGYSTKYTLLSKLMRMFHATLISDQARRDDLQEKFAAIREVFLTVPEFAEFSAQLSGALAKLSDAMAYGLDIDFSAYDPSNFFHSLRVQAMEGDAVRALDEIGSGQEQLLALCLVQAYAAAYHADSAIVLIVDEPESNLHPLAQRWLSRQMHQMPRDGLQVVITTHSPAFIDLLNLSGLVLVRKGDQGTYVVQLGRSQLLDHCVSHGASKATAETVLPHYAAHATEDILAGFFARRVVLVEGASELHALPNFLRQVGLDPEDEGVAVIDARGVSNIPKWWRLFTAYEIPVYCVFDNDVTSDSKRRGCEDIFATLGVPKGLSEEAITTTAMFVTDQFTVFGNNFETCLRAAFQPTYSELELSAEAEGLSSASKPLRARYVSERLVVRAFPSGEGFELLAKAIRSA